MICILDDLARTTLRALEDGLHQPSDTLTRLLATAIPKVGDVAASTLHTVQYLTPSLGSAPLDANASANCGAHIDKGILSLIFPDTEQGLQVK